LVKSSIQAGKEIAIMSFPQKSLEINRYGNAPLLITGFVVKVKDYLFNVQPNHGYAPIEDCYLFCFPKPKLNDVVLVTFANNYTMPVIIGVCQKPERIKADQDYSIEHPSGTKYKLKADGSTELTDKNENTILTDADGVSITDKSGNTLVMAKNGVKVNGHYLMTADYVDWFNSVAATFGLGNLGAPVPLNPSHLPGFVNTYLQPDTYKTDKAG